MTERLGICLYAHQLRELWNIPPGHQPHLRPTVEVMPETYVCGLLDWQELPPPPPIERVVGAFELRPGDCEACRHFHPAGAQQLNSLMRTSGRRWRARKRRAARRTAK